MNSFYKAGNKALHEFEVGMSSGEDFICDKCYLLSRSIIFYSKAILELQRKQFSRDESIATLISKISVEAEVKDKLRDYAYDYHEWLMTSEFEKNKLVTVSMAKTTVMLCHKLKSFIEDLKAGNTPSEDQLAWCRTNAPDALKNLPDEELWEYMKDVYKSNALKIDLQ